MVVGVANGNEICIFSGILGSDSSLQISQTHECGFAGTVSTDCLVFVASDFL
jgi:uncharacterized protein